MTRLGKTRPLLVRRLQKKKNCKNCVSLQLISIKREREREPRHLSAARAIIPPAKPTRKATARRLGHDTTRLDQSTTHHAVATAGPRSLGRRWQWTLAANLNPTSSGSSLGFAIQRARLPDVRPHPASNTPWSSYRYIVLAHDPG